MPSLRSTISGFFSATRATCANHSSRQVSTLARFVDDFQRQKAQQNERQGLSQAEAKRWETFGQDPSSARILSPEETKQVCDALAEAADKKAPNYYPDCPKP